MDKSDPATIFHETIKDPLYPGETTRQDHFGCPAGDDHRKRLYFTRGTKPDSIVLWYCHNCGNGGSFQHKGAGFAPSTFAKKAAQDNTDYIESVLENSIRLDCKEDVTENVPPHVEAWLYSNGLSWEWPVGLIRYDPVENAVVFSIYNNYLSANTTCDIPDAIQHRYFRDKGPKCITTKKTSDTHVHMYIAPYEPSSDTVVIVEDMLSALKIWMQPDNLTVGAYCMFGSNMELSELVVLKNSGINNVIVWLDNDNIQVLKNARTISQRAKNLGMKTYMVGLMAEPKKLGMEQIGKILEGATFE